MPLCSEGSELEVKKTCFVETSLYKGREGSTEYVIRATTSSIDG
jgi:hypothetical protein